MIHMGTYSDYANYLASKYNVDPVDRYYRGDCSITEKATPEECTVLAELWERDHFDGTREC